MNLIQDLTQRLESENFFAYVSLSSNLYRFSLAVHNYIDKDNLDLIDSDKSCQKILLDRISELVTMKPDEGYYHPKDAPIAAYMLLLLVADRNMFDSAKSLVEDSLKDMPFTKWVYSI